MEQGKPLNEPVATLEQFRADYTRLLDIIASGPVKTFAYTRLKLLDSRFIIHRLLNSAQEFKATQTDDPKDFTNGTCIVSSSRIVLA